MASTTNEVLWAENNVAPGQSTLHVTNMYANVPHRDYIAKIQSP